MNETLSITCPHCKSTTFWHGNPNRPFCSERCRLIDLGAWMEERYVVPGTETVTSEQED